jgi:hypothetical protein
MVEIVGRISVHPEPFQDPPGTDVGGQGQGTDSAVDRFLDVRIGRMHEIPDPAADLPLPGRITVQVGVDRGP